jgi:transcriptional regulator with XRE-family HTH domain
VTEDWAAVAVAINQRMAELGLLQRELIERSHVSKSAVSEIQHNVKQRRRSARTLEALSLALAWHPQHLIAVLERRRPPQAGAPVVTSRQDVPGHLAAIEQQLWEITNRLDNIEAIKYRLDQISADLSILTRRNSQPKT